jgi:hypothetical protein
MVFAAPVEGATTSGSKYPRTELRERSGGKDAAWTIADGGKLVVQGFAVHEVPDATGGTKRNRIVIGQIHGPDDELCRLYYERVAGEGRVYYEGDKSGASQSAAVFQLTSAGGATPNIPLNAEFDYTIDVPKGANKLNVSVSHAGVTYAASETVSAFWPGKSLYFKAGLYLGVADPDSGAGSTGVGKGVTSVRRIVVSH